LFFATEAAEMETPYARTLEGKFHSRETPARMGASREHILAFP
jgi:hypothetical protein